MNNLINKIMKRLSLGSILISNLNPEFKERILNMNLPKEVLRKFQKQEQKETIAALVDLRDLYSKTETEVYQTLNIMVQNKQ